MRNREQVVDALTPKKCSQVQDMAVRKISKSFEEVMTDIIADVPDCPQRTIALNKCLESKWACVQAISHPDNHKLGEGPRVS